MVKNVKLTESFRTIRKSFLRFLSLLVMSMLGAFAFAGLQATAPDMLDTLDNYLDSEDIYDIKLTSELGFTESAVEKLLSMELVDKVNVSAVKCYEIKVGSETIVTEINGINSDINKAVFSKEPADNEIYFEENFFENTDVKTGDEIEVNGKKLTVGGSVSSALYFNYSKTLQRGNTNLGTGVINYYAFTTDSFFDTENALYITLKDVKALRCYSDDYKNKINDFKSEIEELKSVYEDEKYEEVISELKVLYPMVPEETLKSMIKESYKEWNILDRTDYSTYADYLDDTASVANLSKLFPVVFYAVAVLVSLISMSKMVEDDRSEIGTFKSLGFSGFQILRKYLLFSGVATITGGIIGALLGIVFIPLLINNIYSILFAVPNFKLGLNIFTTILAVLISFLCVIGSTIFTAVRVLREKPSELMRPKSPKPGKKNLFERIKPLWRKISFSWKITIRNLFRFKKRGLITIIGLAGCTALMLCGFGIRDSIKDIANTEYTDVFKYDAFAYLSDTNTSVFKNEKITDYVAIDRFTAEDKNKEDVTVLVFETKEGLADFIHLVDKKTGKDLEASDEYIYLSEKTADNLDMNAGDNLVLSESTESYTFRIDYLVVNYVNNYVFMTKEKYEGLGYTFEEDTVYFDTISMNDEETEELKSELLGNSSVLYVSFVNKLITQVNNMLNSLNNVVLILIVLSCLLSFVVLYNLNNINIHERKRELATLKVLGFYSNEVDSYITRENVILSVIGILFGLLLGYFLTNAVVRTVEIERARFMYQISPLSFLYTVLLCLFFTIVVNITDHFTLKKIDMIESLKSVE